MKILRKPYLLLFAALALILVACAQTAEAKPQSGDAPQSIGDVAGKCLRSSDETRLLVDIVHGFCVQFPADFDIAYPNESEIMLIKGSMVNVEEPSAHIEVKPAGGMTLEQVADQIATDYAIPGMEVKRTELTIGGEPAIMLDGLSGQDPNRQVVVIHGERLYHFYFIPMVAKESDVYKQVEALYETVIKSFTFRTETNVCPDCPEATEPAAPAEPAGAQTGEDPKTAMISGWVWHDTCASGKDGEPQPASTPEGCVKEDSPLGPYHADGVMAVGEPLIEGVVVSLGEGACPSSGLAEQPTITTDLSYSFSGLSAGTYCVSIDPQREPTFSILRPGVWTYPAISQDVISTTVTLAAGEYKGMVNFGWDYQFLP